MNENVNTIKSSVEVSGLSHDGRGVLRIDGRVVFVPGVFPGEICDIRITKVKKRFAEGELVSLKQMSDSRQESSCPHGECRACAYLELSYPAQLEVKKQAVSDALSRIGRLDSFEVLPCLGMDRPIHYRNKVLFHAAVTGKKRVLGFFQPGTHIPVPVPDCLLLKDGIRRIYHTLLGLVNRNKVKPFDGERGWLRNVLVRESGGLLIRFGVASEGMVPEEVVAALRDAGADSIQEAVVGRRKRVESPSVVNDLLKGNFLFEEYGGTKITFSPDAFAQVNPIQAEKLYLKALEAAGPLGGKSVLDLYCGAGFLGLLAGSAATKVIGIDISRPAIRDAKKNAEALGMGHVRFNTGQTARHLHRLLKEGEPDCVFVDPPRSGCEPETVRALLEARPDRIVYVSCDPGTFSRDAAVLIKGGYSMGPVQPVDMFPWTHHVELVAGFARAK